MTTTAATAVAQFWSHLRVRAYLNDGAKPAGVANIFQAHGATLYPLPVVRVGRVAPHLCVGSLQAGLVLRNAGLQNPGEGRERGRERETVGIPFQLFGHRATMRGKQLQQRGQVQSGGLHVPGMLRERRQIVLVWLKFFLNVELKRPVRAE